MTDRYLDWLEEAIEKATQTVAIEYSEAEEDDDPTYNQGAVDAQLQTLIKARSTYIDFKGSW